ncbi:MAG: ribosome silencing factor [Candidatus Eisenbacteria bacterium]|nr:ribosome silencing factor [Candidatus Eisenbacteria bacterium]
MPRRRGKLPTHGRTPAGSASGPQASGGGSSGQELARWFARKAVERKAEDVLLLDLRGVSTVCDFFVLATGLSEAHVWAIAEWLQRDALDVHNVRPWHIEGRPGDRWILLDYVDWVVHVLHRETRAHYQLERLWGDAPREPVTS